MELLRCGADVGGENSKKAKAVKSVKNGKISAFQRVSDCSLNFEPLPLPTFELY